MDGVGGIGSQIGPVDGSPVDASQDDATAETSSSPAPAPAPAPAAAPAALPGRMAAALAATSAPPPPVIPPDAPPGDTGTFQHAITGMDQIVYKQETDHTCGPASMRMVLEKLGVNVPESTLAKSALTTPWGTLHWFEASALNKYVKPLGLQASMVSNAPDEYQQIKNSLAQDRPVAFLWAVPDDLAGGVPCLHYSVLTGIDEKAGTVTIANPFGYMQTVPITDWWKRFSLDSQFLPTVGKAGVATGLLKPRTAFIVGPQQ
jgi:hypothetical protein